LFEVKSRRGTRVLAFLSPILSEGVLDELYSTLESLAAESGGGPLVLCSAHPSVFLAGAHLAEIAVLDAESSAPYARRGRRVIERLEDYPAPTVAAINGSCSGGGFDLALACDALITGPNTLFTHPGIRRGLVTGWSGTTRLASALGSAKAQAALLETRDLDADSLSTHGAVQRVAEDPLGTAIETARRLAALNPARTRLWRALRGPGFIDRFHASMVHKL
jgi:enoyl-CoA hydratase